MSALRVRAVATGEGGRWHGRGSPGPPVVPPCSTPFPSNPPKLPSFGMGIACHMLSPKAEKLGRGAEEEKGRAGGKDSSPADLSTVVSEDKKWFFLKQWIRAW